MDPAILAITFNTICQNESRNKARTTYCVSREWLLRFIYVPLNACREIRLCEG